MTKRICLLITLAVFCSFSAFADSTNVVVGNVTKMPIYEQVQTFGNLSALNNVTISSEIAGKVSNIFYTDGQSVKKGDLILQLDNTQAKADLISAQADLALAKRNYQRYEELSKYGGTTKEQLDKAQADVNAKQATVQQDLNMLQKYTLTAPFTGRLGSFKVQIGDYVAIGDKIVTLINNNPLKVLYALPEDAFPQLKMGQKVIINVSALPHQQFVGKVTYIAPNVDTNTGTISVQATLNNDKGVLSSGMFATIRQIFNKEQALVVPEESVLANLSGEYVYRVVGNKAIKTSVKTGAHIEGFVEIVSGLKLGDEIITEGQQKLNSNSAIHVTGKWQDHHGKHKSLTIHETVKKKSAS